MNHHSFTIHSTFLVDVGMLDDYQLSLQDNELKKKKFQVKN